MIRLFDPATYHYSGVGESIPIMVDQEARISFLTAEFTVQGAAPQKRKLLIDTGSNDALDDSFVAQSTGPKIEIVGGVGLGKEFKFNAGRVSRLKLGGVSFEDVDAGAGGVALVGGEILRRFTVIFDFAHTQMILEPNEAPQGRVSFRCKWRHVATGSGIWRFCGPQCYAGITRE